MKTLIKLTREKLLKIAKPMVVNLQVAKTIENKSQTRRVADNIKAIALKHIEDSATGDTPSSIIANKGQKLLIKSILDKNNWGWDKGYRYSCQDTEKRYDKFLVKEDEIKILTKWEIGDIIWIREPARVSIINDIDSGELAFEYAADDDSDVTDKKYQENLHKIQIPERFIKGYGNNCDEVTARWIINKKGVPNGCIKEIARTFLKITSVRVERLQDISYEDIMAEGCDIDISDCATYDGQDQEEAVRDSAYYWYRDLWNSTAKKGEKFEDNPYVFVYEFEKIEEVA